MSNKYREAGVDLEAGYESVRLIKSHVARTKVLGAVDSIGAFGGMFDLSLLGMKEPVLVSGTDGVGTKLMLAFDCDKHDTIGIDAVAMCVNDVLVQGAMPIFFLDYLAVGKNVPTKIEQLVKGVADGCVKAGCALVGGETAEMPGMYGDDFDLVGVITGIVEKDEIITGEKIAPGYVAIGLGSNGLHTNGFSLARKIVFDICNYTVDTVLPELNGESVGEALLKPHICYYPAIRECQQNKIALDGIAHITGGGLYDNVPRILPEGVGVVFDKVKSLPIPPIFKLLVEKGNVSHQEAYRVFNMGVGMVWFVPAADEAKALEIARKNGYKAETIGYVEKSDVPVTVVE